MLFEFSETVIVDQTFLAYVVDDSDISVWIGSVIDPFNNHITGLNKTGSSDARWADINAGEVAANVLVIAALTVDETPEDRFKIGEVEVEQTEGGCYENFAIVTTAPNGPTDRDLSHYCNPEREPGINIEKHTNGVAADTEAEAALVAAGDPVVWTCLDTNTGNVLFPGVEVVITDNNGTPDDPGDDFNPSSVLIGGFNVGDLNENNVLDPDEVWEFEKSAIAQKRSSVGGGNVLLWGIDNDGELFSIADYTQISNGAAAAGLVSYGDLMYDDGSKIAEIGNHIGSFALSADEITCFILNEELDFHGQPDLDESILMSFNVNDASTTGDNVVNVIDRNPIPGFDPDDDDNITGLDFDPVTGKL